MFLVRPLVASGRSKCQLLAIEAAKPSTRNVSIVAKEQQAKKHYKLLVVGGGSGGCTMAAKFAPMFGLWEVGIIEPTKTHYYQPMWTLVGGGIKMLEDSGRPMKDVLPKKADWIVDRVSKFNPEDSYVVTEGGREISYDYMIVALGLQVNFNKIKGLPEAFLSPGVCSNYSPETVTKTFQAIKGCTYGNAIFTFPNTPVKCPGAPQKIMYLAEDYFRQNGKRENIKVMYNSSLEVIFGVKKYAARLMEIVKNRDIVLNFKHNLVEVKPDERLAIFEKIGTNEKQTFPYELLHITPPMSAPDAIKNSSLCDKAGFLDVNRDTLQHTKYKNIFGIGDCTNLPTSRTAAAVAAESGVVSRNLRRVMAGKPLKARYDGYTSCPLVTAYGRCILAEFDYNAEPLETFPIDQGEERWTMYSLKKDFMPQIYWHAMLNGNWNGPKVMRKLMHLGFSK